MNPQSNRDDEQSRVPDGGACDDAAARSIEVGPNHRRGITSTLACLDEVLCDIDQMLDRGEYRSEFYVERNTLSELQKQEVKREIVAIRQLLAEVRERLDLEPVTRDVGTFISGTCMMQWESLIELQGRYLKRFGTPSRQLVDFLDPISEEIVRHLDQIVRDIGVFRLSGPSSRKQE